MMGAATEKVRLPRFSLVLGIESCWEADDMTVCMSKSKCISTIQLKTIHS